MSIAMILLIAGAALTFYIVAGYPLLLALVPFRGAPPVRKDPEYRARVTVIVAVYNGAAFVAAKLDSILALDYPRELMEIIIVSDGSTDHTEPIVQQYADRGVVLISAPRRGKASALNDALRQSTGDLIFFTDIRQPLHKMALAHLVANFADPSVGVATGLMRLFPGQHGEQADMDLYWRYEVWARRKHSLIHSTFTATGCIYAIRRSLVEPLPADTLSDDAVLALRAFFSGYRVILDTEAIATDYPALPGTEFRRRFRTLAGLWQTFLRHPRLFSAAATPMRFHFLSHKFSRLLLPWAVLLTIGATFALPNSSLRFSMVLGERALVFLAFIDQFVPAAIPVKRLTSPARTFVAMNLAALAAAVVFFVPASWLWVPTRIEPIPENRET
jgi:cellulose synthase/poly-beta-1,6-N-acetylglucosamine synthase-like glycosyltransferase